MVRIRGLAVSWARHIGWAAATLAVTATVAWADRPRDWQLAMQESVTPTHAPLDRFHDLLPVIITLITVFLLALLLSVFLRSRSTHTPLTPTPPHHPPPPHPRPPLPVRLPPPP